jgi:hypothetical protein
LDVKYAVGSNEKHLDPGVVFPYQSLQRGGRPRRGRDFLQVGEPTDKAVAVIVPSNANDVTENKAKTTKDKKEIVQKGGTTLPNKRKNASKQNQDADKRAKQGKANNNNRKPSNMPESSPQAPTTPSTPEQKKKPMAKKVTPIPSVVTVNQLIDVSPLDRISEKDAPMAKARRGLFESTQLPPANAAAAKKMAGSKKKAETKSRMETGKMAIKSKKPKQEQATSSVGVAIETIDGAKSKKVASSSAARKQAPTKKAPPKAADEFVGKKIPGQEQVVASKPILQLPRPKGPDHDQGGSRKPLKDVYEDEVDKARKFVSDVVGARDDDIVVAPSKENQGTISAARNKQDSEQEM